MTSGIREGRWLCRGCGAICRGRDESCNGGVIPGEIGCNRARPAGTRFFLPENTPYVTAPDQLADAHSGVDWHCDHCDGANKGSVDGHPVARCAHCGNGRDGFDKDVEVRDFRIGEAPSSVEDLEVIRKTDRARHIDQTRARRGEPPLRPADRTTQDRTSKRGVGLAIGAVILVLGVLGMLIWSFLATTPHASRVSEQSWERQIEIERFATLQKSGWDHPSDARILSSEIRQRTTRQIIVGHTSRTVYDTERYVSGSETYPCGSRDMGNGYFQDITCSRATYATRQVSRQVQDPIYQTIPVMDDWYRYEIDRWVHDRFIRAAGQGEPRQWPDMPVLSSEERRGASVENLRIRIDYADGGTVTRVVSEAEWLIMPVDTRITAHRNFWGTTRSIEVGKN